MGEKPDTGEPNNAIRRTTLRLVASEEHGFGKGDNEMMSQRGVVCALAFLVAGALVLGACSSDDSNETTTTVPTAAEEAEQPSTEIEVEGRGASMLIEPSVDNVISGVVTVSVTEAPSGTNLVFYAIVGENTGSIEEAGANLGMDVDGSDGWSRLFDTSEYENGLYEIAGLPASDGDSDPLGFVTAQVLIQN